MGRIPLKDGGAKEAKGNLSERKTQILLQRAALLACLLEFQAYELLLNLGCVYRF